MPTNTPAFRADSPTIADLIRWGTSRLAAAGVHCGHGMASHQDEAAFLLAHVLSLTPIIGEQFLPARVEDGDVSRFADLIGERIVTRQPAAYLVGETWFAGLRFAVDRRVLVPRSPLAEFITDQLLDWLGTEPDIGLDLCTGSGCIGAACAVHLGIPMVVSDISAEALELAASNFAALGLTEQIRIRQGDLFAAVGDQRFDFVITNPPYVPESEYLSLPAEYHHEPDLGLRSGPDGLDIPLKILQQATDHLTDHGLLVMEVGTAAQALDECLDGVEFSWIAFERGGTGVMAIYADQLAAGADLLTQAIERRGLHGQ